MQSNKTIARSLLSALLIALTGCAGGSAIGPSSTGASIGGAARGTAQQPSNAGPSSSGGSPTTAPKTTPSGAHTLTFVNHCAETVWVGALTNDKQFALPDNGGWQLDPNQSHDVVLTGNWGGRFWGRTHCTKTDGVFKCETGDCGGATCDGRGGQPASLAEFLLFDAAGKDFYDVSLVDAFNLPIGIAPTVGTLPASGVSGQTCGAPTCAAQIDASCPAELQQKNASGAVVACFSACSEYNTPQTCCTGDYDTSPMCPPTPLSKSFKAACPDAYSYAYDDKTSTYNCTATGYTITFCPNAQAAL